MVKTENHVIYNVALIPDSLITFDTTTAPLSPACLQVRDRGI